MFNFQSISVKGPATSSAGEIANMDLVLTAPASALTAGQVVALPAPTVVGTGQGVYGYISTTGVVALATQAMCEVVTARRVFGVVLADAAANGPVTVRVRGVCKALMTTSMTSVDYGGGSLTVGATSGSLTNLAAGATGADFQLALAIPLEATGTAAVVKGVLFDGISAFGVTGEA